MSEKRSESPDRHPVPDEPTRISADAETLTGFQAGQTLGDRYEVRSFLGRGGMGEVWHAFDLKLRVEVALKALRPEFFTDLSRRELLRQEVRAAREVVSPNVCRIFDLIEIAGQELVSMEHVDGTTLLDVLQDRGPLELREAGEIASQFLAGLEAIHQAGLVHRDVKPENIMITRTGRVVLMDFGLARQQTEGSGTVAGTPAYMAPEQALGKAVDARADVYSAGVVLAEMICPDGILDLESRQSVWEGIRSEPVVVPDTPWAPVLKQAVSKEPADRHPSAHALIRALEQITLRVEKAEDLNPYPGLASFSEQDAEYFFGRETEVEQMWRKLQRPHLLAVIGPSGAGKTSFLRAGLIPTRPASWGIVLCTPGSAPFLGLRHALVTELSGDTEAMHALLREDDLGAMVSAVSRWRQRHGKALLIVDQFEELFTLNPPEVQARFTELLGRLALEADVHVLLSMRDDFLFHCHDQPPLAPILDTMTLLGPPTGAALRRAILQPALKCGYRFEDEALGAEMLAEVEGERGSLPLLAFTMARLWEKRDREEGQLTRQAYQEIGGVGGALAQHAEATLERVGSKHQTLVRELFRNLVTAQGTRAARDTDDLLSVFDPTQRDEAASVLQELIGARLLTSYEVKDEQEASHQRVEIVHESLLVSWPRLIRWQNQDADAALLRDQLRQAAQVWEGKSRSEDLLWTGSTYREFALWRERYPGGLTATEEAFARAMTQLAGRRRRRRRLAVTGAFVALLAVLLVVGSLWRKSVTETRRAEAARLLALAEPITEENRVHSLAYTIASLEQADSPRARLQAMKLIWMGPTGFVLPCPPQVNKNPWSIDFSPDGRWLAAGFSGRDVVLWSAEGGEPKVLRADQANDGITGLVRFDPESRYLVTSANIEAGLRFWSVPEGELLRFLSMPEPTYAAFIGDGSRLITACSDEQGENFQLLEPPLGDLKTYANVPEQLSLGFFGKINPDGSWAAVPAGKDIHLWSLDGTATEPTILSAMDTTAASAAFDHSGKTLVICNEIGRVELRSFRDGQTKVLRSFQSPTAGFSQFDASGSWLTISGWTVAADKPPYPVSLWNTLAPPDADPWSLCPKGGQIDGVDFHPQSNWLAVAPIFGIPPIYGVTVWPLMLPHVWTLQGHESDIVGLAFHPDGGQLISAAYDCITWIWPLSDDQQGTEKRVLLTPTKDGCQYLKGIAVDPLGRFVVVCGGGPLLQIPLEGGPAVPLEGFQTLVTSVAIDAQGHRVAAGSGVHSQAEAVVRVWDPETGQEFVLDAGDGSQINDVAFTPEGQLFASGPWGIRLWNIEAGTFELLREEPTWKLTLSPDGNLLLCTNWKIGTADRFLHIYNREEQQWRTVTTHGPDVSDVVLDPSGTILVTLGGSAIGKIVRVGPVTGEEPHLLIGHSESGGALTVSPDGQWIASGATDGSIQLWPMPDLTKPPVHLLPADQFVARLKTLTNLRAVADEASDLGYSLVADPFPGWEKAPTW
jgi:WD40 repeat protein